MFYLFAVNLGNMGYIALSLFGNICDRKNTENRKSHISKNIHIINGFEKISVYVVIKNSIQFIVAYFYIRIKATKKPLAFLS